MSSEIKRQIANAIQDMSVGRCVIVGYHKVYAVSESASKEMAEHIVSIIANETNNPPHKEALEAINLIKTIRLDERPEETLARAKRYALVALDETK